MASLPGAVSDKVDQDNSRPSVKPAALRLPFHLTSPYTVIETIPAAMAAIRLKIAASYQYAVSITLL
jgi:hypothetical protein